MLIYFVILLFIIAGKSALLINYYKNLPFYFEILCYNINIFFVVGASDPGEWNDRLETDIYRYF